MEENKNLNPEIETENADVTVAEEITEKAQTAELENSEVAENKEAKKEKSKTSIKAVFTKLKSNKPKKLKNQALLKRGSYSLAITAAVIAGAIILNILVGALNSRFVLEFDMSENKDNSIAEENIDFIKGVEDKITVTVCAAEDSYSQYMGYYARQYEVQDDAAYDYYAQTIKLIKKYEDYNKNIEVKFIDPQSSEFTAISSKYSSEGLAYGDIVVATEKDGKSKHKKVGFTDIYSLYEDSTYASYGYTMYTVSGNNIETALTGAIDYVTSDKIKKAAVIMGHTTSDYTSAYLSMLKENNYEYQVISDSIVNSISSEYDLVVIPCPSVDFIGSELDAIAEFLDNDGALNKGLIFIADVTAPYLTNLYDFLSQWGIAIDEGILFETNANNYMPDDPTTLGSYPAGEDKILSGMELCITGYNIPMYAAFENEGSIKTSSLMTTPETTVAAPKGTTAGWTGADKYEGKSYSTVIQSMKSDYDEDNELIASYVTAFSSSHFLESQYSETASVSNKNILFAVTERASGSDESNISFVSKYITNESFSDKVTAASSNAMRIIFMFMLPILTIAAGVYVYIKRKNA